MGWQLLARWHHDISTRASIHAPTLPIFISIQTFVKRLGVP